MKLLRRFLLFIIISFAVFFVGNLDAKAGFGIAPPFVKSNKLIPGSHYEQEIRLLRSSAEDELVANITINAPEIQSWISIREGNNFDLPKDKLQVPMIVNVDVPDDAALGNYSGHINVRIEPKAGSGGGGVAVALGARIDIDLTVSEETIPDFTIRSVKIPDVKELNKPWSWRLFAWFFYRIKVVMKIENTGNIATSPSKVQLDITDLAEKKTLETLADTSFKKVEPFKTRDIIASFPTKLGNGQYWAKIKIYKGNEIFYSDKIAFTINPLSHPKPGPDLGIWPWVMVAGIALFSLLILLLLIKIKIWKHIYKLFKIILWPLIFILKQLKRLVGKIRDNFWKWMHRKAAERQGEKEKSNDEKNKSQ
jgi:hypothetical protein